MSTPPPVALIPSPQGLYLVPLRPLTAEQCVELAERLAEHAERQRPGRETPVKTEAPHPRPGSGEPTS